MAGSFKSAGQTVGGSHEMRWQGRRQSENVEDQRGMGPVGGGGGMLGGRGVRVGGFGIGGTLVILLLGLIFGFDPSFLLNGGYVDEAPAPRSSTNNSGTTNPARMPTARSGGEGDLADFVSVV